MIKAKSREELKSMSDFEGVSNEKFISTLNRMKAESKDCLESAQFNDYVFRPEKLDEKTKNFIQNHLERCPRCRYEVDEVKSNLELYATLPSLDI